MAVDYKEILHEAWLFRKTLLTFIIPILLLPLAFGEPPAKAGYAGLILGLFWLLELLPLGVTSMIPLVLFPALGLLKAKCVSMAYFKDSNVLFIGGLIMAIAVEQSNLHKRLALKTLSLMGSNPRMLMMGFMVITWFLSMWISNTATTAMMLPIVIAVLDELTGARDPSAEASAATAASTDLSKAEGENGAVMMLAPRKNTLTKNISQQNLTEEFEEGQVEEAAEAAENGGPPPASTRVQVAPGSGDVEDEAQITNLRKGMIMCIAFAANIGGTATLTGTTPNLVLQGQAEEYYHGEAGINFFSWMMFGLPTSSCAIIVAWLWLQLFYFGFPKVSKSTEAEIQKKESVKRIIQEQRDAQGSITFRELIVLVNFVILVLLWLTREPKFVDGWGWFFKDQYISDGTAAILMVLSLFLCPARRPTFLCCRPSTVEGYISSYSQGQVSDDHGPAPSLLDWKTVATKIPWDVVFLMGAGYALADASESSGLSGVISSQLVSLQDLDKWVVSVIVCSLLAVLTQFTSNTAATTIILPVLAELSQALCVHPLYLMLPATVVASYAFVLPVATPPNALIFASGELRVMDMVKAGVPLNLLAVVVVNVAVNAWGVPMFGLDTYPSWGHNHIACTTGGVGNSTTLAPELSTLANNLTAAVASALCSEECGY